MSYRRRKKRPSPYRFLKPLYYSPIAVLVAMLYHNQVGVICSLALKAAPAANCPAEMPDMLALALITLFVFGIAGTAYRYYRDWHKGDYYLDHPGF